MKRFSGRMLCLLLALLTMLPACSSSPDRTEDFPGSEDGAPQENAPAQEDAAPETEPADPADFVPEGVRYDGLTVRVLTGCPFNKNEPNEIAPFEDDYAPGEIIPESVVRRNDLLYEKLGVTLEAHLSSGEPGSGSEYLKDLSASVAAGANDYDAVCGAVETAYKCAVQGLLVNLNAVESLDLSHPWWSQKSRKSFDFGADNTIIYFMDGDINFFDNWGTECIYANRDFLNDSGYAMPYDIVREGGWTFDLFRSIAAGLYRDLDGDGVKSFGDAYGIVSNTAIMERFLPAMDAHLLIKDEEGRYVVNETEEFVTLAGTLFDLCQHDQSVWLDGGEYAGIFQTGNAAFSEDYLYFLRSASGFMEDDYGVLPYPKRDESQPDYSCTVNESYATVYGISLTAERETVGLVLDTAGAYSPATMTEAVIENGAMIRNARDEDTAGMLRIILDTSAYSFASLTNWGNIHYLFNGLLHDGRDLNYASEIKKVKKVVEKAADKDLPALRDPKG